MRQPMEFYEIPGSRGYGYVTYEDEDGWWWWEFWEPCAAWNEDSSIAAMGPFSTRCSALEDAVQDFRRFGDADEAYMLTLLEHADYYRYAEEEESA